MARLANPKGRKKNHTVVRIVCMTATGLGMMFLVVACLFSIVSMKASHQWLVSSDRGIRSTMQIPDTVSKRSPTVDSVTKRSQPKESKKVLSTQKPIVSEAVIEMCSRTLWHTLETTTIVLPNNETFIHTGDIDDLWLRDSAAQVHPLLIPILDHERALIYDDEKLDRIISGLIARHAMYIRHDPYANAFRIDDSYVFSDAQKRMGRHDLISTWNYELDSGCYTIRLLYFYWKASRHPTVLISNSAVHEAVSMMIDLWIAEQHHEEDQYPTGALFDCKNCNRPYRYPGLARNGKGTPTNSSSGLTWTGFRPSDDECKYGFLVPANMFTVTILNYAIEMAKELWHDDDLVTRASQLQRDILRGIQEHAIVKHPKYGKIYAYEVDGLGNSLLMDDANVPSLLSLPYLEYPFLDQEIYANTRRFLLSHDNPTFSSGTNDLTGPISGIGSPHMAQRIRRNVWPMAMAIDGIISKDAALAEQLVQASAKTGWMHESFDVMNPRKFTRSWFCWADSLFAELALRLLKETDSASLCLDRHTYKVLEWRDPMQVVGSRLDGSVK